VIIPHTLCNSYWLYLTCLRTYSSHKCAIENLQFASKHLVAMNPMLPGTFPCTAHKFWMFCMCSTHQPSLCIAGNSSHEPSLIGFFLFGPSSSSPCIRKIRCCTMGTPQNIIWGTRRSRNTMLNPQNFWDSFLLTARILEASKEGSYLGANDPDYFRHEMRAEI
jgi:hypothetical protein